MIKQSIDIGRLILSVYNKEKIMIHSWFAFLSDHGDGRYLSMDPFHIHLFACRNIPEK